jgi:hypothetical protein
MAWSGGSGVSGASGGGSSMGRIMVVDEDEEEALAANSLAVVAMEVVVVVADPSLSESSPSSASLKYTGRFGNVYPNPSSSVSDRSVSKSEETAASMDAWEG